MTVRALVALCLLLGIAHADVADDAADRAFREASTLEDDGRAIDRFERLGATRPVSRWTDDAWSEAARRAERAGDLARARRDHEQVIAIGTDAALVARSRAALTRLTSNDRTGHWDAVAVEHERLVNAANAGGDPSDALHALERLVHANPTYPHVTSIRLSTALGWETEGETARALELYRQAWVGAAGVERVRAGLAYARAAIRADELELAETTLESLASMSGADTGATAHLRDELAAATRRRTLRRVLAALLAALVVGAIAVLRRESGSWHAVARRFAKPPMEALFLAPIAIVIVVVARTGNPLVANAVTAIAVVGVVIAYLSGVALEASTRTRRRLAMHAVGVLVVVGLVAYLAIDRYRLLDLVRETAIHGVSR